MLKKFSIISFILISILLIVTSTQNKTVPHIDMLTTSGDTISTKDLKGSSNTSKCAKAILDNIK